MLEPKIVQKLSQGKLGEPWNENGKIPAIKRCQLLADLCL